MHDTIHSAECSWRLPVLEHYSHVRLEAKRRALDAIAMHRPETPNPEAAAGSGHVIKHVINGAELERF